MILFKLFILSECLITLNILETNLLICTIFPWPSQIIRHKRFRRSEVLETPKHAENTRDLDPMHVVSANNCPSLKIN